jgi:hypothetical protein
MSRCWMFTKLTGRDREKICRLYQQEKLSEKIIGMRFNMTEAGVRRVLREEHVTIRNGNCKSEQGNTA